MGRYTIDGSYYNLTQAMAGVRLNSTQNGTEEFVSSYTVEVAAVDKVD